MILVTKGRLLFQAWEKDRQAARKAYQEEFLITVKITEEKKLEVVNKMAENQRPLLKLMAQKSSRRRRSSSDEFEGLFK